jgi:hypothetical protein
MKNFIYKYNEDGSIDDRHELKKTYVLLIVPIYIIYIFNINPSFNNKIDTFLASIGLNVWYVGVFFIVLGYFVFGFIDKHFKPKKFKKLNL